MKFRKKPVVIEAIHWNGAGLDPFDVPTWMYEALKNDVVRRVGEEIHIDTLEGTMHASPGDWIICGIKGEIYPCKPDIFAATHEPVA